MRLLLTRPQPGAARTAAALCARGHAVTVAPLLRIEVLPDAEIGDGPWTAILVTSANAAAAIAAHERLASLRALPVFAVGPQSAAAMRAAGFTTVAAAGGDLGDLARLAAARLTPGDRLLYLAGADRSGNLAGELGARGLAVSMVVLYRAVAATALPPAAVVALAEGIDGVLHFSRRSAEAYVHAAQDAGLDQRALRGPAHFCLSAQVAQPLAQAGAADIRIAPQPREAALIALIAAP